MNNQVAWANTFTDSVDELTISCRNKIPLINKVMLAGFALFVILMIAASAPDLDSGDRWPFILTVLISLSIGLGIAFPIIKIINKNSGVSSNLVLNKKSKNLTVDADKFSINLRDVNGITIEEDAVMMLKIPRLKLILSDGKKTLLVNFESYTKAQEAKSMIEKYL